MVLTRLTDRLYARLIRDDVEWTVFLLTIAVLGVVLAIVLSLT